MDGDPGRVDGEAHHGDGPLMVAWSSARREAAQTRGSGRDVVLHEFAHKLDMLDGTIDGTPLIDDADSRQRWIDVCTGRVRGRPDRRRAALLRSYAGTNPGEFFAVATETFFTRPVDLRRAQAGALRRARDVLPPGPGERGSSQTEPAPPGVDPPDRRAHRPASSATGTT